VILKNPKNYNDMLSTLYQKILKQNRLF